MKTKEKTPDKEIPGLEDILNGNNEERDKGWDKFYKYYHFIVTVQVAKSGILKIIDGNLTAVDVAHEILAKMYYNGPEKLKNRKIKTDEQMTRYFRAAVYNYRNDLLREKMRQKDTLKKAAQYLNKHGEVSLSQSDIVDGLDISILNGPDKQYECKQLRSVLQKCRPQLSDKHVIYIDLHADGLTQPEIAKMLNVGSSSVGVQIDRARVALLKIIRRESPEMYRNIIPKIEKKYHLKKERNKNEGHGHEELRRGSDTERAA